MNAAIEQMIQGLQQGLKFVEIRSGHQSAAAFEGVLLRSDLPTCRRLLESTLGPPLKDFNQTVTFEPTIQRAIALIGGIRIDQCLFFASGEGQQVGYAALWPWASDANRITLKAGLLQLTS